MVIQTAKHLFSIKMPTNKVFENQKVNSKEPDKTRVSEDIISAHLRKKLIDKKDQLLGVDPDIILLTDYVSFKNPKTGNGILIRDLTKLNDGFYYLPVMSVPYAGIKIARMHNSNVHDFWGKYLAKSVGRAKAKLLLRYGIQLTHPHGQNILLQLDADYLPTGRVAFRDIGDSYLANKKLARALHIESETQNDKANDIKTDDIKFSSDYTFKRFDTPKAPRDFSDQGTLKDWNRIHNESFLEEVFRFTGQSAKEFEALKNYRPSKGNERYHTYESDILKQSYFLQMYLLDNNNVLKALAKIHSKTE